MQKNSTNDLLAEGLMTVEEAGKFLSLSRSTIWKLMTDGELVWTRIGSSRRIPRVAVYRLAAKRLTI